MNIEEKRKYISQCYPGWTKVKTMPDSQVGAIFASCIERGINPKPQKKEPKVQQLTIFDMMKENEHE